ncbi:MAG: hypothetical protein AAF267_03805 [Deinococcota bacterium]
MLGTALLMGLLVIIILSAVWECWRYYQARMVVASAAWRERQRQLQVDLDRYERKLTRLESNPDYERLQELYNARLEQAVRYALDKNVPLNSVLDRQSLQDTYILKQHHELAQSQDAQRMYDMLREVLERPTSTSYQQPSDGSSA